MTCNACTLQRATVLASKKNEVLTIHECHKPKGFDLYQHHANMDMQAIPDIRQWWVGWFDHLLEGHTCSK